MDRVKPKSMFAIAGAAGGTLLITSGVAVALMSGGGGEAAAPAELRPSATSEPAAARHRFSSVLQQHGADACTGDAARIECRYHDRYVASVVLRPGRTRATELRAELKNLKSGVAQNLLRDQGPFAILQGADWLVTGPDPLVESVRGKVGGRIIYCERPYGKCGA